ncbi:hypothetical protein PCC6912_32200 [Chlorogloeopsis fritschii PCC 6912]|uniref:Uncharacterized protein n=1 Tax=Chlorogloeopsis fritschii PCC 6912 TaxID=211165 RepID=A0A3S1FJD8_CHLFR|nr:hypothetical protein PCC6912_32200 [Chlorogloeopsis fritschii PCC 6912]
MVLLINKNIMAIITMATMQRVKFEYINTLYLYNLWLFTRFHNWKFKLNSSKKQSGILQSFSDQ